MASTVAKISVNNQNEILRTSADFPEDIWSDRFSTRAVDNEMYEYEIYAKEIERLKEDVRAEIEEQLEEIFDVQSKIEVHPQAYDLFTAALHFRLMRQHGFNMSCGIFDQFRDASGKFKESLATDIKGLLSLYQAAHVRTHSDRILEEALDFTTVHLKSGALDNNPILAKQVKYALQQALHKGIPRIEARHYISIYEEEESNNNPLLLRLAKLDYNSLQMLHKQELAELIRWENDLEFVSKLPYSRARVVESYFFALGMFFEPQYSVPRIILAKTTVLLTGIDDTYDVYGTLDEIKSYTDAMERWDINETDRLPSYMRTSYMALLCFGDDINNQFTRQGRSYAFDEYKGGTSYIESGWFVARELPTFPDYLSNGLITGLSYILITATFAAMEHATEDVFHWLSKNPKIAVASAKICRLINDVGSYESEKQRRATGIECYMKHYNVSEQEALEKFGEIAEDAWKDINEEFLKPRTAMPREILMRFLNIARVVDVFYKHREDGFTNPHKVLKPSIIALLVDPAIV
ncbi:hypothetical protein ACH5RR_000495 [Cinchona calisaya]|uniref:Uncharacterized protein n=1 Tax=Cinchona calisaya TaxID=153742 RepID=A0ABD3B0Y8_9GENT